MYKFKVNEKENNINNDKKKITYLFLLITFLMVAVTGTTYAYFAISAINTNTVVGTAAEASLSLNVERILPSGTLGPMVPQLEQYLGSAISTNYNCIDGNGNTITSTYLPLTGGTMSGALNMNGKATVTNNSTATARLNGTIKFSGISNMPNLKWKRITDARTIGSYTSAKASTSNVNFETERAFLKDESQDYYFVIWIDETNSNQTDKGTFGVTIEFNPSSGNGLTSTLTTCPPSSIAT